LITTVAGNGRWGYAGDGGAATNASLSAPTRLAFDSAGNLYIADSQNSRIRMVNTNGIITTVAGNGSQGYSGDGGAATNATLYWPAGIALDAAGELYIADNFNNRIRKVATNGIITTVAGDGPSNSQNGGSYSGDGGLAVNAGINAPNALVFDISGNLYFADSQNNRIRKVTPNGIITTVAGNGTNGFAGDAGPATSASLAYPIGLTLDAHGNLLIGDSSNHRVREAAPNGLITTVAGNGTNAFAGDGGPAANADLNYPEGVAFDISGNVYIADTINSRIRMVGANNIITTVAGNGGSGYSGDGGMATNASLFYPMGLAWDASGNLYIADFNNNRVRKLYLAGFPVLTLTNVTTTSAGNYAVVITSPYGSVTSAVVSLTVTIPTTPPQIITGDGGFGLLTNQFGFNLNGAYGQTIVVDGSTNLLDWTPLFTNTANGAPFYFFDPAWTNFPWRFYRARLP
jgi:sugar lactone lactonase YvrE